MSRKHKILFVGVSIAVVLSSLAISSFIRARHDGAMNACINNLRQIDAAKKQWELEAATKSRASMQTNNPAPAGH
jgi:hypothetical protein